MTETTKDLLARLVGFTPGPWESIIDDCGQLAGRPGVSASADLDCSIVHWDGFVQHYWRSARGDKEVHANVALIAAAPDLHRICTEQQAEIERLRAALRLEVKRSRRHLAASTLAIVEEMDATQ
jgi:hypothetical protein